MPVLSNLLSKRIPTLLGLMFLIGGLGVGIFIVNGSGTGGFFPKASPETTPKQMRITNISDTTFTVSFLTDTSTPGYVKYGTEPKQLKTQVSDDRDQLTGSVGQFTTHHITVRSLNPSTPYYFAIGTAGRNIYTDNDKPYTVSTAARIAGSPEALTIYGSVLTKASTPASDSIVYLSLDGATALSTLVKSSGSWAMPISTARTIDLKTFISTTPRTRGEIFVQGKDSAQTAQATFVISNAQPVAAITLGQTYDFTGDATQQSTPSAQLTALPLPTPESTTSSKLSGSLLSNPTESTESAVEALGITFANPSENGEELNTTKPALQGTGPANTKLTITVESDPVYQGSVTTGTNGSWSYTPTGNLKPGDHTVTVSYTDANGVVQSEKRTFVVLATGTSSNPAFTSTPSATIKPTPTASATAKPRTTTATGSGIPQSGSDEITYAFLLAGAVCVIAGLFLWQRSAVAVDRSFNRALDADHRDTVG